MNSYFLPETGDSAARTLSAFAGFGFGPLASAGYARLTQERLNRGVGL